MSTHTYLIASSVGGSILSIFREQAGEPVQCSLWNATVDPNKETTIVIPNVGSITFWRGSVYRSRGMSRIESPVSGKRRSAEVMTSVPIETIICGVNEYLIEHPELVEAA